jgi:hypothetical protein
MCRIWRKKSSCGSFASPTNDEIRSPEAYLFTIASHVFQQHQQK